MVDIISGFTGVPNAEICCVGDRLYTDIAVAVNAGAQSVLVMSGETTPEILAESETKPGWVHGGRGRACGRTRGPINARKPPRCDIRGGFFME